VNNEVTAGSAEAESRERDEVDAIVAAWQRERGDLDPSPLYIFSRLLRLGRHLDRFRRQAFAAHGLEPWEFEMLSLLRRQGEPWELAPSYFMNDLMVPSGTLTHRISVMVDHGFVVRHQSDEDKRVKYVRATPLGIKRVDAAMIDLLQSEAAMVEHLSDSDQAELARILRELLLPFEAS